MLRLSKYPLVKPIILVAIIAALVDSAALALEPGRGFYATRVNLSSDEVSADAVGRHIFVELSSNQEERIKNGLDLYEIFFKDKGFYVGLSTRKREMLTGLVTVTSPEKLDAFVRTEVKTVISRALKNKLTDENADKLSRLNSLTEEIAKRFDSSFNLIPKFDDVFGRYKKHLNIFDEINNTFSHLSNLNSLDSVKLSCEGVEIEKINKVNRNDRDPSGSKRIENRRNLICGVFAESAEIKFASLVQNSKCGKRIELGPQPNECLLNGLLKEYLDENELSARNDKATIELAKKVANKFKQLEIYYD